MLRISYYFKRHTYYHCEILLLKFKGPIIVYYIVWTSKYMTHGTLLKSVA